VEDNRRVAFGFQHGDALLGMGRLATKHSNIGDDVAGSELQVDALLNRGDVAGAYLWLKRVADVSNHTVVDIVPQRAVFEVGVHAWKRVRHALT
jgi:hypothetical protein